MSWVFTDYIISTLIRTGNEITWQRWSCTVVILKYSNSKISNKHTWVYIMLTSPCNEQAEKKT